MIGKGVAQLTGKTNISEAWQSLVSTQDVVGIKVFSAPGANSGTRPAVVSGVIEGLLSAGLGPSNIVVWDRQSVDLRLAGFYDVAEHYGVRAEGALDAGQDASAFYENPLMGQLVWGDLEFGKKSDHAGRKSYVSKLLTARLTKIISIAPVLNHNLAGVSGTLFSLATGSVDNTTRFESAEGRLGTAIPEIYALPAVGDKVVLCIADALVCQYEGGERGLLHYSAPVNELRFSRDPVALDVLSLRDLVRLRHENNAPLLKSPSDLYNNAALLELGTADLSKISVETVR